MWKSSRILRLCVIIIAVPAVLLVLVYLFLAARPTGLGAIEKDYVRDAAPQVSRLFERVQAPAVESQGGFPQAPDGGEVIRRSRERAGELGLSFIIRNQLGLALAFDLAAVLETRLRAIPAAACFLLLLHEQGWLTEPLLADLQAELSAALPTPEEEESLRKAVILREGELYKERLKTMSGQSWDDGKYLRSILQTLSYPVFAGSGSRITAANISGRGEALKTAQRELDFLKFVTREHLEGDILPTPDQLYAIGSPRTVADFANLTSPRTDIESLLHLIAALRFHMTHGQWPEAQEELTREFLEDEILNASLDRYLILDVPAQEEAVEELGGVVIRTLGRSAFLRVSPTWTMPGRAQANNKLTGTTEEDLERLREAMRKRPIYFVVSVTMVRDTVTSTTLDDALAARKPEHGTAPP